MIKDREGCYEKTVSFIFNIWLFVDTVLNDPYQKWT